MLTEPEHSAFDRFIAIDGVRLRRALVARFGIDVGNEVTDDALGHAWARWDHLATMTNPTGYLFRYAQSAARRHVRWQRRVVFRSGDERGTLDRYDEGLLDALGRLTQNQRVAVLLVHGHGYRYDEVAEVLGVSTSAVTNHVHRGLQRLRSHLEVHP
jgi:RNA polymerase sigma factor (sigma-70 family)